MTPAPLAAPHHRRAYDHRLREHVCRTGARALGHRLQVPRSTISSWKRRGLRAVVSHEVFDQDRQKLLSTVEKLERRARILAATVRLLLALLRASGFRLVGERLPQGATKASILRAVTSAQSALPLALILRILGMQPSRYHAWRRVAVVCGLDDRSPCPRTVPGQLTAAEIATVKDMVLAPEHRHMPLRTLSLYAQRVGRVFASASTWARLVRDRGWRRPRLRVHPAKPTVGVRATRPNELWHIDVSVLKLSALLRTPAVCPAASTSSSAAEETTRRGFAFVSRASGRGVARRVPAAGGGHSPPPDRTTKEVSPAPPPNGKGHRGGAILIGRRVRAARTGAFG